VGIAITLGGGGSGAASLGVAAATDDIADSVETFITDSSVTAAGNVELSATETAVITTLAIGGAISAAIGEGGGGAIAVAGSESDNTIKNKVWAYIKNSRASGSTVVSAGTGGAGHVTLSATDSSTITANGGGAGIAVAGGAGGGVSLAVG